MSDDSISRLREQLEDLQTRYAFQEDTVSALNASVAEHRRQIDRLEKQVGEYRRVLEQLVAELHESRPHEKPPHY